MACEAEKAAVAAARIEVAAKVLQLHTAKGTLNAVKLTLDKCRSVRSL